VYGTKAQSSAVNRGKAVESKSTWETWRVWAAFLLGAAAFVVSLVTGYVTTFLVVDELRVVVESEPLVQLGHDNFHISVKGPLKLLFINSGTRPISILGVSLVLGEVTQEGCTRFESDPERNFLSRFAGRFERGSELKGKFDGMVVEAKKIASSMVTLEVPAGLSPELASVRGDAISVQRLDHLKHGLIVSCLLVKLATISVWPFQRSAKLSIATIAVVADDAKVDPQPAPIILYTQSRTIFSSD
jgi:hypothetical protein